MPYFWWMPFWFLVGITCLHGGILSFTKRSQANILMHLQAAVVERYKLELILNVLDEKVINTGRKCTLPQIMGLNSIRVFKTLRKVLLDFFSELYAIKSVQCLSSTMVKDCEWDNYFSFFSLSKGSPYRSVFCQEKKSFFHILCVISIMVLQDFLSLLHRLDLDNIFWSFPRSST